MPYTRGEARGKWEVRRISLVRLYVGQQATATISIRKQKAWIEDAIERERERERNYKRLHRLHDEKALPASVQA